ncbi:MAG: T9SS type A sorting domain-containing protein [Bacteroidota bacterium]
MYVGISDNIGTPSHWVGNDSIAGRSLPIPEAPIDYTFNQFRGHPLYDGPSGVEFCHFANFTGDNVSVFSPNTAATKGTVHFSQGLTFSDVPKSNKFTQIFDKDRDYQWTTGLIDLDGSIDDSIQAGDFIKPRIFPNANPDRRLYDAGFNVEVGATYVPEWEHYICRNEHYALLLMYNDWSPDRKNPMYSIRSDGHATITEGQDAKNQIPVIVSNNNYQYRLQYHRMPDSVAFVLKFLRPNDFLNFAVVNVPSDAVVQKKSGGNLFAYANQSDFDSGSVEGYFFDNNTVHIRLVGQSLHNQKQFGSEFPYISSAKICLDAQCGDLTPAGAYRVPLADYGHGLDERASLSSSGNLSIGNISSDLTNEHNSFQIVSDGDGLDEYIEYRLDFPRQAWSEFNNLEIDFTGPQVEVLLFDQSEGAVPLGRVQSTACHSFDLTRLSKEQVDEVTGLLLRISESTLGDLTQSGLSATVELAAIHLDYSRDLSDFHRTTEAWNPTGRSMVDWQSDGTIYYTKDLKGDRLSTQMFKGLAPVEVNDSTYVVLRMKPIVANSTIGQFFQDPWGTTWLPGPTYNLGQMNQYQSHIVQPNWYFNLDMQRFSFDVIKEATAEAEIDYIRFTNCPTCYNGIYDPDLGETDIDCGGSDCPACPCEDSVQNNGETGIDCGGPNCAPCSQLVFENGVLTGVTSNWMTVNTVNTYTNMVVVATPVLNSFLAQPVVTRIRNITTNSFELKIQKPSGSGGNSTVHYFVVEEGVYTEAIDGIQLEAWTANSSLTAHDTNWAFENHNLVNSYTQPVVLGQVQSHNDSRWSVFWASEQNVRNNPPSGHAFSAGKHVAEDPQTDRADETLGLIVLEAGLYQLNDQLIAAGLGADIVKGVQNAQLVPPVPYVLSDQIDLTGAVLSAAAMDGINGGWPVLFGTAPVVNQQISIAFDEDMIQDIERNHTTEQVAYLAFGDHAPMVMGSAARSSLPTSSKLEATSALTLYPNPAQRGQGLVLLSKDRQAINHAVVSIHTLTGQSLPFQKIIESEFQLRLEVPLDPGVYLIRVVHEGMQTIKKLIVSSS